MCSWCYGFKATYKIISENLIDRVPVLRLLGGLAPDTNETMPAGMQAKLQQTWRHIEQVIPGTEFNHEFWDKCKPRRATYSACRAVIAARLQGEKYDHLMTEAIQNAYYQKARNPSDLTTLTSLAAELGLDISAFEKDLGSPTVDQLLTDEIKLARSIGIASYPSLAVVSENTVTNIDLAYTDPQSMLNQINVVLTAAQ